MKHSYMVDAIEKAYYTKDFCALHNITYELRQVSALNLVKWMEACRCLNLINNLINIKEG